ncbi:MAG: hypothetical protein QNK37_07550 [Acidobacteriota bacterium]|nr:hypothetical protein [Acidobacteriota bacterium]
MSGNDLYPLQENIGDADLFTGREKEFEEYGKWISLIPRKLSKSRVILGRKKSGKTAFVQRIFNKLWMENGPVIPFYIEIPERRTWYPDLAFTYLKTFGRQYISFLERDAALLQDEQWDLDDMRAYGVKHDIKPIVRRVDALRKHFEKEFFDSMWDAAIHAPHAFAALFKRPFLVIIDEFQNLSRYVYLDKEKTNLDETIPGSYHALSESKIAPMLATGSAVGWLVEVVDTFLEAGRLSKMPFSPYLSEKDGLTAVYRYAETYNEPITNETALLINELCRHDPFFIACTIRSRCPDRDLTTREGVIRVIEFETSSEDAELASGWITWFERALSRINEVHAKRILLLLSRNPEEVYSALRLKTELQLDLDEDAILEKLVRLRKAELIRGGLHDRYSGLRDGTFFLLLQRRLGDQLTKLDPEADQGIDYLVEKLTGEKKALQNQLNQVSGRLAEAQLEIDMRVRGSFQPADYFEGFADDPAIRVETIYPRHMVQGPKGHKGEIDLRVDGAENVTLLVEVKKTERATNDKAVAHFAAKVKLFADDNPDRTVLAGFLSLGGFTEEAAALCKQEGIGTATEINYIHKQWD